MRIKSALISLGCVVALAGCGKGAKLGGGKEGAAQALSQIGSAGNPSATGGLFDMLDQGIDISSDKTIKGRKGGEASVSVKISAPQTGTGTTSVTITATYKKFSWDGANTYDGTMAMTMTVQSLTDTSAEFQMKYVGKVTITGKIDDFIDADVTQTISLAKLSQTSGSVTATLNGTIKTSTESYTYTNESITVKVDAELPAASS